MNRPDTLLEFKQQDYFGQYAHRGRVLIMYI